MQFDRSWIHRQRLTHPELDKQAQKGKERLPASLTLMLSRQLALAGATEAN